MTSEEIEISNKLATHSLVIQAAAYVLSMEHKHG